MPKHTVKSIDRQSLQQVIRPALERKLEELSAELGIQVTATKATYDPNGKVGSFKLELAVISESGVVETRERVDYRDCATLFGLPEDGLDMTIEIAGEKFKIAGLNMRARKNKVLLAPCDGNRSLRVTSVEVVKQVIKRQ